MEIKILKRQGKSLRAIAKESGVAVNTARKYLSTEADPMYSPRPRKPWKLDPYRDYLQKRIDSARPHRIPAVVLLREIREMGYPGGISQLRSFVAGFSPKKEEVLVRFETLPGKQMQVDWVEFKSEGLFAFVATLGHSRVSFVEYREDMQLPSLLECHIRAFEFFGGVPEEVLYDNMKTVVLLRDAFGKGLHRFHPALWDLCKHYGFMPRLCRPYRAKTKGKVERFNGYFRHSFHVPLLTKLRMDGVRLDRATASLEVRKWLKEVANRRHHRETGRIPWEVFEGERLALRPLPLPYQGKVPTQRPVSHEGNAYPTVPPQHALGQYDRFLEAAA